MQHIHLRHPALQGQEKRRAIATLCIILWMPVLFILLVAVADVAYIWLAATASKDASPAAPLTGVEAGLAGSACGGNLVNSR